MGRSKSATKVLQTAVYKPDFDVILNLALKHRSKRNNFSLCDELKSMKDDELNKFLEQLLERLMEKIFSNKDLQQNSILDWTKFNPEQCNVMGDIIQATSDIALACIQCDFTLACRIQLVEFASFFNSIILAMPDAMDSVKNSIAQYCEKLFLTGQVENSECFLSDVLVYLVRRTLGIKKTKQDVKRIYAIRKIIKDIIEKYEFSTALLWPLFIDAAVSQTYLSITEGQKVISHVMVLNHNKLLEIHNKIVSDLPGVSKQTAEAYGQVYFLAWCCIVKSDNQEMRDRFEIICLRKLIHMAIYDERKPILPIIEKIVFPFLIHKGNLEVSKMLLSLYLPVVYGFLKNPKALYRSSAAALFIDAFPIQDPCLGVVDKQTELNVQLLLIRDLLLDHSPKVRITAVLKLCFSISVNWELIPEDMMKTYFKIIIDDLCKDSSTPEVRMASVQGLKCFLENPLIIRSLTRIFPKTNRLFHDIDENVRIAYCHLLLKVKQISSLKYTDLVPVSHLFARLEEDCHAVKKCLTSLLHNSYFPKNADMKVCLGRCLDIMGKERLASRVFFTYVPTFIEVEKSVDFILHAAKSVYTYVKYKNVSTLKDVEISRKQNVQNITSTTIVNQLEQAMGFNDMNIVNAVMEAITILWLSLKSRKEAMENEDNRKCMKLLVLKLSTYMLDFCLYYKDTEAWENVFYLASFLPSSKVPSLTSLCISKIKNLPPDAKESDYISLLICLSNQFKMGELLNVIKEWLEGGLTDRVLEPAKKKQRRGRKAENIYHDEPKPYLANQMLNSLLIHGHLLKRLLLQRSALDEILCFINDIKGKLRKINVRMSEAEADFLHLLLYNLLRISIHLHVTIDNTYESVPFLDDVVKWINAELIKYIAPSLHKKKKTHFLLLVLKICKNVCEIIGDVQYLDYVEKGSCLYLDFIRTLLASALPQEFILVASKALLKHGVACHYMYVKANDTTMLQQHLQYVTYVFDLLNNETVVENIEEKEFGHIIGALAYLMRIINYMDVLSEQTYAVFKLILTNILHPTAVKCEDIVKEMAEDPFDRLSFPMVANFFWAVVIHQKGVHSTYIKCLSAMLKESPNIDASTWIAYWMITWGILSAKSVSQSTVRRIRVLVLQLEKCLYTLYPRRKCSGDSQEQDSVEMQLFKHHCRGEYLKLKNRVVAKMNVKHQHVTKK